MRLQTSAETLQPPSSLVNDCTYMYGFFLLFVRNLRRITSGPTLKPWRLSGTELCLLRSLLKSQDTLKYRSSVSAISLLTPSALTAGGTEVLELCSGANRWRETDEHWVNESSDGPLDIISSHNAECDFAATPSMFICTVLIYRRVCPCMFF